MNEQWFYKFVSFVQEINYEKKKEIKFSRISKKRENHHELKSKLLVLHLPTINHNSRVTVVHVSTSEEPLSLPLSPPHLSPTEISLARIEPHTNLATYTRAHAHDNHEPRCTRWVSQQITEGRRPEAVDEFCPHRFMLAACGVVFEAAGGTTQKKKKKKQPRWRRGKRKK